MKTKQYVAIVSLGILAVMCGSGLTGVESPAAAGRGQTGGKEYVLTLEGQQVRFVAEPQKGYVVKLAPDAGGIRALSGLSALDAEGAREIRGLDRRGVWTIENVGPASRNEDTIRSLRGGGRVAYAAPLFSVNGEMVAVIPKIVIRVKPGVDARQVHLLCQSMGLAVIKPMEFTTQEYLLQVLGPDAEAVFAAVEQLSRAAYVEWVCPNTASKPRLCGQAGPSGALADQRLQVASAGQDANSPGVFPNDEYFPKQWHLHNTGQSGGTPGADIRAPEAWEITTGDPNIVVAEFGGYVDANHLDLVNNLVPGYDFVQPGSGPVFDNLSAGHSTWCAGIIAAQGNNKIGVTGVTWNCKVMPIRIWEDLPLPAAHRDITEAERATAIRWAATNGADVMDNQWGGTSPRPLLQSAIVDVTKPGGIGRHGKGCVVVFCNGLGKTWYPGCYPEAICVGSTDHNDIPSPKDYRYPEVDIVAPDWAQLIEEKGGLWTTDVMGPLGMSSHPMHPDPNILDYSIADGATSIVSGVAALILSVEPNLTGDEVRHFLERSAKDLGDPGRDDYYGWGRVDARAALDMVIAKRADLNNDCIIDEEDQVILMKAMDTNDLSADIAPASKRDGVVDAKDLELLRRYQGTVLPGFGLIAYWRLDETEGIIVRDSTGERHDATMLGTPLWRPDGGKIGGALQLSGVMNCVMTPFVCDPSAGAFSAFVWVKGETPGQVVLSQAGGGATWLRAATPDGTLATELRESGGTPLVSQAKITDGNWHRVGVVWTGSSRILYVDGVEVARDTQSALMASTGGLYIGSASPPKAGTFWKGLIDDVRIYNRVVKP